MLVLQCKKGCEKDMLLFEFDVSRPVEYALTGKFEAPTPSWQHQLAPLIEYELFVVTKDTLYISYAGEQFEVSEGEFLILPPTPPPPQIFARDFGHRTVASIGSTFLQRAIQTMWKYLTSPMNLIPIRFLNIPCRFQGMPLYRYRIRLSL